MRKRLKYWLLLLLLALAWAPLTASANSTHIEDGVGLFTAEEIQSLEKKAQDLSDKIKGDVYLVTTNTNSEEPRKFSDDYLREKVGNNNNGAVLLFDMGQREIYLATSGNMIDYITDSRRENMLDQITPNLADGLSYDAATAYFDQADAYVEAGVPGGHYRIDEETGKITYYKTITWMEGLIALLLAAVAAIAFFVIIKSKYQLKLGTYSYPYQENADVNLTVNENQLVNSFVTTRRIPRNTNNLSGGGGGGGSSTHSSGGGTFGGGGRSF